MKSLKLNQIEKETLSNQELSQIKGGGWVCTCSCYWEGNGGSSTDSNSYANGDIPGGGHSKHGDNAHCVVVITP